MESLLVGEREVVERTFALMRTLDGVFGRFWMSNFRVLFEFSDGCFEELLESVGVAGTVRENDCLLLLIDFHSNGRSFQWKLDFQEELKTREIFDRLTFLLDNLEQEG
jgi:hypothetical protein